MAEITPQMIAEVNRTGRHMTVKNKSAILCDQSTEDNILLTPIGTWNALRVYRCSHCKTTMEQAVFFGEERRWQVEKKPKGTTTGREATQ